MHDPVKNSFLGDVVNKLQCVKAEELSNLRPIKVELLGRTG